MKICPNCRTQYTDETLRFCLQDGAALEPLHAAYVPDASPSEPEMETVARRRTSVDMGWKNPVDAEQVEPILKKRRWPRLAVAAVIAAAVLLLMTAGGIIGIWFYLKGQGGAANANSNGSRGGTSANNTNRPTPTRSPTPTPSPGGTRTPPPAPTPPDNVVKEQISREISQQLEQWQALTQSGDLDGLMGMYADSVKYYRSRGAAPSAIRADKARAFRRYELIEFNISALEVTVGDDRNSAIAAFDKEWYFDGPDPSSGKVRQELEFRRINGKWLITGERDIKVYFTN